MIIANQNPNLVLGRSHVAPTHVYDKKFNIQMQEQALSLSQRVWQLFKAVVLTVFTCGFILFSKCALKMWQEAISGKKIVMVKVPVKLEKKTVEIAQKTPLIKTPHKAVNSPIFETPRREKVETAAKVKSTVKTPQARVLSQQPQATPRKSQSRFPFSTQGMGFLSRIALSFSAEKMNSPVLELTQANYAKAYDHLEFLSNRIALNKVLLQCPQGKPAIFVSFIDTLRYLQSLKEGDEGLTFKIEIVNPSYAPFVHLNESQSLLYFKALEGQGRETLKKIIEEACQKEHVSESLLRIFGKMSASDFLFYFPIHSSEPFKVGLFKALHSKQYTALITESSSAHADVLIDILQIFSTHLMHEAEYKKIKLGLIKKILSLNLNENHISNLFKLDNFARILSLEQFKCFTQKLGHIELSKRLLYFAKALEQTSHMRILERIKRMECISLEQVTEILAAPDVNMSQCRIDICTLQLYQLMLSAEEEFIPKLQAIFKQLRQQPINEHYRFGEVFSSICNSDQIPGTVQCLGFAGPPCNQHLLNGFIRAFLNREADEKFLKPLFDSLWLLISVDDSFLSFKNVKGFTSFILKNEHLPILFETLLNSKLRSEIKNEIVNDIIHALWINTEGNPKLFKCQVTQSRLKLIIEGLVWLEANTKTAWLKRLETSTNRFF